MSRKNREAVEELAYGVGGIAIALPILWWAMTTFHDEIVAAANAVGSLF